MFRRAGGAAVWRPAAERPQEFRSLSARGVHAEAARSRPSVMATLSLKNIVKNPGATEPTVHDFNLEIADKEFIVLVGPSGCGKSTTLRMIAGLEDISEGELYIGDRLVNDVAPKDRDIAMVFQNYALYPHMTVYENMAFALKLRKVPKEEIDKKVREAAEFWTSPSTWSASPRRCPAASASAWPSAAPSSVIPRCS